MYVEMFMGIKASPPSISLCLSLSLPLCAGDWSCPTCTSTGRAPPASAGMTLTRVDRRRVVWFGGWDGEGRRRTNAVFILDTVEMVRAIHYYACKISLCTCMMCVLHVMLLDQNW